MDRKLEGDDLALEKEAGQRGVRVLPFFSNVLLRSDCRNAASSGNGFDRQCCLSRMKD